MQLVVDPLRKFEIKNTGVAPVLTAIEASGSTGSKLLVAAASGKRHRVAGWIAQGSTGSSGAIQLFSNNAGTAIMAPLQVPGNGTFPPDRQIIDEAMYMETLTGQALYVNVTAAAVNLTLFYITYTP